jgi:hypothetical protein
MSKNYSSENAAKTAKAGRVALKLRRSLGTLSGVLNAAKRDGTSIPDACKKLGMHPNYANTAFHFLKKAEKKSGVKLHEITQLEALRDRIKNSGGYRRSKVTVSGVTNTRKRGTGVENAIAGMRHAVENRMNLCDASMAIGKASSFLSMSVTVIDKIMATEEQKKQLRDLYAEYKELASTGAIRLNRKVSGTRSYKRKAVAPALSESKNGMLSALSNINGVVEYKYPVITNRPIPTPPVTKKTYPLEELQPGHAFAVPANKKQEVSHAKRAVTMFAKENPGVKFTYAKDGNEFVIWRTE